MTTHGVAARRPAGCSTLEQLAACPRSAGRWSARRARRASCRSARLPSSRASFTRCASPPRQRRRGLAELHVAEADVDQRLQDARELRVVREQLEASSTLRVEHVGDVLALVAHARASRRCSACPRRPRTGRRRRRGSASRPCTTPSPWQASQRPPFDVEARSGPARSRARAPRAAARRPRGSGRRPWCTCPGCERGVRPIGF